MIKQILIVEDQEVTLLCLKKIVEDIGEELKVYAFSDLSDAYRCAIETKIDLFIVDIVLNSADLTDTSGLRFIEDMRQIERYAFVPVIFITALEDPKFCAYEKLHCYSYIEKPFNEVRVKKEVRNCLKFPGNLRESRDLYIRKDGVIFAVNSDNIIYVEMVKQKLHIHTVKGEKMTVAYMALHQIREMLDGIEIIQCRRNIIVNAAYIDSVDSRNRLIRLKDNLGSLEIGLTYMQKIKEYFQ